MRSLMLRTAAVAALALGPMAAHAAGPGDAGGGAGVGGGQGGGGGPAGGGRMGGEGGGRMQGGGGPGGGKMGGGEGRDKGMREGGDRNGPGGGDRRDDHGPREGLRDNDRGPREGDRVGGGDRFGPRGGPLIDEERTRVRGRLRGLGGERIGRADFGVRVGGFIPDGRYRFNRLPPEIFEIVPQYRGYDYLLVGDQILIIEPGTRRIVDVLD